MAIKLDFKKLAESSRIGDANRAALKAEVQRLTALIAKAKAELLQATALRQKLMAQLHLKKAAKAKPATATPAAASIARPANMSDVEYSIYQKTLGANQ